MRHLPRHRRALTMKVNQDPTPEPTRFDPPACCGGFKAVTVRAGTRLVTVHCWECVPSPAAGVIDDIEREDDEQGYETENAVCRGWAA
ncbi:MAG: hypothetical protein JO362_13085 [Streptomycetaceae bacterium]|nr:hypothetical protein [Streptomycetaceae bacterium]